MNKYLDVLGRHLEAENAHDMQGTLETLHPDCVFEEVPFTKLYQGIEGARIHYDYWWSTFDLHFEKSVARHWTTDDRLIAEAVFGGRHIGPYLGIEPTNREISYPFLVIVDFRDNLLVGEKFYFDVDTICRQITG